MLLDQCPGRPSSPASLGGHHLATGCWNQSIVWRQRLRMDWSVFGLELKAFFVVMWSEWERDWGECKLCSCSHCSGTVTGLVLGRTAGRRPVQGSSRRFEPPAPRWRYRATAAHQHRSTETHLYVCRAQVCPLHTIPPLRVRVLIIDTDCSTQTRCVHRCKSFMLVDCRRPQSRGSVVKERERVGKASFRRWPNDPAPALLPETSPLTAAFAPLHALAVTSAFVARCSASLCLDMPSGVGVVDPWSLSPVHQRQLSLTARANFHV